MHNGDRDKDIICAISTPHGVGGISVIRVSGPKTLEIVSKICPFLPQSPESHHTYFGSLIDFQSNENIDEVLAAYFRQGRSFTGEEVIEISCHGSPTICQLILAQLVLCGARSADRGEFTYRAFMNGKLDLVQAEGVLSLIESQSKQSASIALRQLKGSLSKRLELLEDKVVWILAHAEASIDFSTEGITVVEDDVVKEKVREIESELSELVKTFKFGRIIKDGFQVVLTGLPNVGKSSLLNLFLEDERAIVTDIPGTTRDVINGDSSFNGFKFTFIDTAGLRDQTEDLVERIGIQKSYEAQAESDAVLFVFDVDKGLGNEELRILSGLDAAKTYIIGNKIDKVSEDFLFETVKETIRNSSFFKNVVDVDSFFKRRVFFVSALDKKVRTEVLTELVREFSDLRVADSVLITNARHYENLLRGLDYTRNARVSLAQGVGAEFLALELKVTLIAIQETLGKRFDDQVMDRVFKEFCIGK